MIKLSCPSIDNEEVKAVSDVLTGLNIAEGERTREFEDRIRKHAQRRYAVAVSSGTSALRIALLACGLRPGDKVILTPFACDAVLNVILDLGCEPVFCDVDEDTFNLSPESLMEINTKTAKAIVCVHTFGFPCDMDRIRKVTGDMIFIEDAAQAVGSNYKGRPVGSFGDVSFLSFYATKLLTTGEGGILLTDDENVHIRARYLKTPGLPTSYLLRHPGQKNEIFQDIIPLNCKMTDMQAAMGIVQLSKLEGFCKRRREIASMYNEGLKDTGLKLSKAKNFGEHVYSRYTLTCRDEKERNRYVKHLIKNNIEIGILWSRPLHMSPLLVKSGYREGDFPVAEKLSRTVFSIPIHPNLTDKEADFIIEKIREM